MPPSQWSQRVLLVGSHPSLCSQDLSRARKVRWSHGHTWRGGCMELMADSCGLVLRWVAAGLEAGWG